MHIFSRKDTSEFAARLSAGGGGPCHAHIADALKPADIAGVVAAVERASGRVDVLVNNAGINHVAPMGEADIAMFKKVLDVNVTAAFGIAQAFFPLLQRPSGRSTPTGQELTPG